VYKAQFNEGPARFVNVHAAPFDGRGPLARQDVMKTNERGDYNLGTCINIVAFFQHRTPVVLQRVRDVIAGQASVPEKPDLTVGTIHQMKGSEHDYVHLANDLGILSRISTPKNGKPHFAWDAETGRLWFVATTRARKMLAWPPCAWAVVRDMERLRQAAADDPGAEQVAPGHPNKRQKTVASFELTDPNATRQSRLYAAQLTEPAHLRGVPSYARALAPGGPLVHAHAGRRQVPALSCARVPLIRSLILRQLASRPFSPTRRVYGGQCVIHVTASYQLKTK